MRLVIGCPVLKRGWVLDAWFDHVERACEVAELDPHFVFVGSPEHDRDSFDVIERRATNLSVVDEFSPGNGMRNWSAKRYVEMVGLRNLMLAKVRELEPDYFLSLDSDILLHELAIKNLEQTIRTDDRGFGAVGGRCYMCGGQTRLASWARLTREERLKRSDSDGVFKVDVIMAIKLMSPAAYNVDYKMHTQGEDTGWSKQARRAGVLLGWDGRVISKHLFERQMLHEVDPRVGW